MVSEAEFKKLRTSDGLPPRLGVKLDIDRYHSQHPVLEALAGGGALFLVTVLPGDVLWLVAMLGAVRRFKGSWKSQGTMTPVVDLTPVCGHLGITRGDGKLAMRLKTPRVLDDRQWAILHHIEEQSNVAWRAGLHAPQIRPYVASVPKKLLRTPKVAAPPPPPPPPVKLVAKPKAKTKRTEPPKPVKVPKLAKGQFAFVHARTLDADAILALDKAHEGQFIEAMYAYAGIRKKTGLETLETFLRKNGWQPSDFSIELWDVYEGGRKTPRFEFWVQNAGDGTLFEYGRATSPKSIGSTQHSFESHGADDPKTLGLVEALQTAAEKSGAV